MLMPALYVGALGLAVGVVLSFFYAHILVRRWILHYCQGEGPDYIANNVRGKILEVIGWLILILAILVLADAFHFARNGILHRLLVQPFFRIASTGNPMWFLWGGWGGGLLIGSCAGAYSSLRRFNKCQHIGWRHLVVRTRA